MNHHPTTSPQRPHLPQGTVTFRHFAADLDELELKAAAILAD